MQTGKGQRQQQASEATESGMQTRAASALEESVIQEDGNDKEHEFQIAKQLPVWKVPQRKGSESLTSHTHLDTRKHICESCGVACGTMVSQGSGLRGSFRALSIAFKVQNSEL